MGARARSDATGHRPSQAHDRASGFGPSLLAPASGAEAPYASPAQRLQDALAVEFAAPPVRKWPPLVGIGFVMLSSGLVWGLVILALSAR